MSGPGDTRLDEILEVLMALARQDFARRAPVSDWLDEVDAIATGINLLAEELDGAVASRRELEAAYASLKNAQAQLVVAEKFAAIGQLASGVAHELNNPATWVLLGLEHGRRRIAEARAAVLADPARAVEALDEVDAMLTDAGEGMERIRVVVGDLGTLSRTDRDQFVEVSLNDIVRSATQLARPAYQTAARVVLDLQELPPIRGSRARLGQLVTNLILNAAQAVGDGGGDHEIVIATRVNGTTVVLAVEDTGPGIPPELHERVFEPYFTTKPAEVGTGLGLAIVRKTAFRHGGAVRIAKGRRSGARIEVELPTANGVALDARPAGTPTVQPPRRARVLVVDDEPLLLRAIATALEDDHDVTIAHGGSEALVLLDNDRAFDLVLCDLQMPRIDGQAIYDELARRSPELLPRLVFMTGGAVTPRMRNFLDRMRPTIVDKPIRIEVIKAMATAAVASP